MDDYDDMLPSPGGTMLGLPGGGLLSSVTGNFAVPTPPYSDGSWEMYQDFVGGLQFWGYALASGSGDGGVRMWDSKCLQGSSPSNRDQMLNGGWSSVRTGQAHRTLVGHTGPVTCLQFDETYIISGSLDKTIRVSCNG
jgi:division protein 1